MKKSFTIGIIIVWLLIPTAYSRSVLGTATEPDLLSRKIELHLEQETLMFTLSSLSAVHRVPIGIEYSAEDKNQAKINLNKRAVTVREVLDSIVAQEPLYRWELVDGVINFVPVGHRDPFIELFLNTRVGHFNPGKWTIKFQVRDAIGEIPEVRKLLKSHHKAIFKYGDYVYYPSIYTKQAVDLKMSNTTVRGVLNRFVRDSEYKHWSIRWRAGTKEDLSINL